MASSHSYHVTYPVLISVLILKRPVSPNEQAHDMHAYNDECNLARTRSRTSTAAIVGGAAVTRKA
jgi:hypothetical protein